MQPQRRKQVKPPSADQPSPSTHITPSSNTLEGTPAVHQHTKTNVSLRPKVVSAQSLANQVENYPKNFNTIPQSEMRSPLVQPISQRTPASYVVRTLPSINRLQNSRESKIPDLGVQNSTYYQTHSRPQTISNNHVFPKTVTTATAHSPISGSNASTALSTITSPAPAPRTSPQYPQTSYIYRSTENYSHPPITQRIGKQTIYNTLTAPTQKIYEPVADNNSPLVALFNSFPRFESTRIVHNTKHAIGCGVMSPRGNLYRIESSLQTAIYGGVFAAIQFQLSHKRAKHDQIPGKWTPVPGSPDLIQQKVALKIMFRALEKKHGGKLQEDMLAEEKFQRELRGHPNILSYDEIWRDRNGTVFIAMQKAEYEDLFEVLKKRKTGFAEKEARWLFQQLLSAANYLHTKCIAFRDHSLENVLVFQNAEDGTVIPKITDPGQVVRIVTDVQGRVKGFVPDRLFGKSFRPPEVYSKKPYNPIKIDTFCLGWMLFFAVTKHQPFDRALDTDPQWALLKKKRYSEFMRTKNGSNMSPDLRDLIWKMLEPDPAQRPTVFRCLEHPWFRGPKTPIDDRTLTGQVKSENLPMHPIFVKKQQQRKHLMNHENERRGNSSMQKVQTSIYRSSTTTKHATDETGMSVVSQN
eukprot:GHVP01057187.1.p1 GENE.GHVP01057187.1~~GHVP01057187.1.p1  ORF type:complete len:645 (+),score=55.71 GHVP01057187.1:27-1937(+)